MHNLQSLIPKLHNEKSWVFKRKQNIVIGTDLDSLLSALLMSHFLECEIVGIYDLTSIYIAENCRAEDIKNAIWLDLDIYHEEIHSIGHHIVSNGQLLEKHRNSLNPNLLRGIHYNNYNRKYPFSTLFFLMGLYGIYKIHTQYEDLILWLPDSSWKNSIDYKENTKDWTFNWLDNEIFKNGYLKYQNENQTVEMKNFIARFISATPLSGAQCRFTASQYKEINYTFRVLSKLTGWNTMSIPKMTLYHSGRKNVVNGEEAKNLIGNFNKFFDDNPNLFSYAITYKSQIIYTLFPRLSELFA